jgi:dTDP-4-amino-4,6-dideoxygalactose transaminase
MRATFLPFSPPSIGEEEIAEVVDTLRSNWITTGPRTKRFEEQFAAYVGAESALAVSSCTDALLVALAALGVGPGDAVFTTTMTFCSTVHVIEHLGATPELVDIEPATLNIDPTALRHAVAATIERGLLRPRVVLPVHYGGHPCSMATIDALAAEFGLAVVEDAAPDGVVRATAFSFYATKNVTTGEGGMLTGPVELLDEARLWALHGMSRDSWKRYGQGGSWYYEVVRPGFKCNMTDIQAAIGIHQLTRLETFQRRRRDLVDRYHAGLDDLDLVRLPTESANVSSAWHLFPIRLDVDRLRLSRDVFIEELHRHNIGASVHFIPVHTHPYYRDRYGYEQKQFPVAWGQFERLVTLPLNPRLSDGDVDDVVEAVRAILLDNAL